ncbi:hypothetical protein SCP_0202960 [Sparassis crispa]|uniref:Protein-S-isoprenylcysteine O-methyltransferase n=1 Tax=Sparassis crispa TaxID=139825 RepID=A0A401GAC8_9APHY|nr:hypothetical protein SCP_0202960 [Sparassis crispa]GBE79099.1 hypothetical protein SCP_0202960 [Sparassis crispa]
MTMNHLNLKLPLLLSAAYIVQLCVLVPQPPPKEDAQARFISVEPRHSRETFRWLPKFIMRTVWAACLCESAILIAYQFPAHHLSRRVLQALIRGPAPDTFAGVGIRVTVPFIIGWCFLIAGTFIRQSCYRTLGHFFTAELALHEDHKLVTSGPYTLVRHPSYTGGIMGAFGVALMQMCPGSWLSECMGIWDTRSGTVFCYSWFAILGIVSVQMIRRTGIEDRVLKDEFGKQWEDWAQGAKWRLVPGIF